MNVPWFPEDLPDPVPPPQGGCIVTFTGKLPRESCAFTRATADQRPIMTRGQRFASFKLACPGVIVSSDKRSVAWCPVTGISARVEVLTCAGLLDCQRCHIMHVIRVDRHDAQSQD